MSARQARLAGASRLAPIMVDTSSGDADEGEPDGITLDTEGSLADFLVNDTDETPEEDEPEPRVKRPRVKPGEKIVPGLRHRQDVRFAITQNLPGKKASETLEEYGVVVEYHRKMYEREVITYVVGALETAPSTGKKHVQMYIELPPGKKKSIVGVKKIYDMMDMQDPHIEQAMGTAVQNRAYCLKEYKDTIMGAEGANWFEFGEARPEHAGKRMQLDWAKARDMARAGKIQEIEPSILIQHYGNLKLVHFEFSRKYQDLESLDNYWFYGLPGVGKSRLAREHGTAYNGTYFKDAQNKWFDQYAHEECVVLDDLEKDAKYQGHLLKTISDRYPMRVEMKGASTWVRPKSVVVTSNYRIEDIWEDKVLVAALRRRFKVVHVQDFHVALGMYKSVQPSMEDPQPDTPPTAVEPGFVVPTIQVEGQ